MSVKIFLSAVSAEFADYREELRRDLTRHNVEVKIQEDFKDAGSDTLDKLDLYISHCDAVVQLAGDMTGSQAKPASAAAMLIKHPDLVEKLPPLREPLMKGEGISYTQWEAWLAAYHGKTLLIAQADANAPRAETFAPTPEQKTSQQLHLQRLSEIARYPGFTFTSPENLARQLAYTAVLDLIAREAAAKLRPAESVHHSREFPLASIVVVLALLLLTPIAADRLTAMFGLTLGVTAWLIGGVGGAGLALAYLHYFGVLGYGAAPDGSAERLRYDALRAGVAAGGMPTMLYSRWLTRALDAVDRFFGDAGKADQTLFPRAFGLKTPAPLWTAASFDRCLWLALVYPIVTIFAVWALSGHVGPAEDALSLSSHLPGSRRALLVLLASVAACGMWAYTRTNGWRSLWLMVAVGVITFAFSSLGVIALAALPFAGAAAFSFAWPTGTARKIATDTAVAFSMASAVMFGMTPYVLDWSQAGNIIEVTVAFAAAVIGSGVVGLTVVMATVITRGLVIMTSFSGETILFYIAFVALFIVPPFIAGFAALLEGWAARLRKQGIFLFVFSCGMMIASLALPGWSGGAFLLFLGLLPLINAPFDWLSLGLTRALLRRGLELGGWWPYLLAILDAMVAGVIIALLSLVMVVGVQASSYVAFRGGGGEPHGLRLGLLFNGLAAHPEAPEYWWLYALLLSTMIPSLLNLVIGGTALARAAPGMTTLLLSHVPAGRDVPAFDRAWVALVLTVQVAGGVVLGVVAQALLAIALIRYVMPTVGLGLLDMARAVATFNVPEKIAALLGL